MIQGDIDFIIYPYYWAWDEYLIYVTFCKAIGAIPVSYEDWVTYYILHVIR